MSESIDPPGGSNAARRHDLVNKLRRSGNFDPSVLQAMLDVPREAFVDHQFQHLAYDDNALPIASGQTISQPTVVAKMTTELAVTQQSHVLEIGTGSGYQAAVLSRLARNVISIERHADLAKSARDAIAGLGIANVEIHVGDGSLGWEPSAPYDRILVTAASREIPEALLAQLRRSEGSRLLAPVGDQQVQDLIRLEWTYGGWEERRVAQVRFVPLRGAAGWSEVEWTHDSKRRTGE